MCFSDLASCLPDLQKSMLTNFHSKGKPASVLFSLQCSAVQVPVVTSHQSRALEHEVLHLQWLVQYLPTRFCCCSPWATGLWAFVAITFWSCIVRSAIISIHDSTVVCQQMKSGHPSLSIHGTSILVHELHESVQEHRLGSLDEMRSQESFEIVHIFCWFSQEISV